MEGVLVEVAGNRFQDVHTHSAGKLDEYRCSVASLELPLKLLFCIFDTQYACHGLNLRASFATTAIGGRAFTATGSLQERMYTIGNFLSAAIEITPAFEAPLRVPR